MTNFFGGLMCIGFTLCYLPQIFKMIKNKSSKDVSLWMHLLTIASYCNAIIYMFLTEFVFWLLINYVFGLLCCLVTVYFILKYNVEDK